MSMAGKGNSALDSKICILGRLPSAAIKVQGSYASADVLARDRLRQGAKRNGDAGGKKRKHREEPVLGKVAIIIRLHDLYLRLKERKIPRAESHIGLHVLSRRMAGRIIVAVALSGRGAHHLQEAAGAVEACAFLLHKRKVAAIAALKGDK